MAEFFFDTPYWVLGLLLIAGTALLISGNNRQERKLLLAGVAVFAIAALLLVMSLLVDTDGEKVEKRTRQMVHAVEQRDSATVERLLHPAANCLWMKKPDLVEVCSKAADDYHIKRIRVTSLDVRQGMGEIIVPISVLADLETSGWSGNAPSTWELVWVNGRSGWLLRDIRPQNVPVDLNAVLGKWKK